jgi:hypothetical protein
VTQEQIDALAFEALDLAVGHIQKTLGVMSGDTASHFFNSNSPVLSLFKDYIEHETHLIAKGGRQ